MEFKRIISFAACLSISVFVSGCASRGGRAVPPNTGCNNNPYLKRYNCSLSAVQQAAIQGDADAQYALGYMYYYGLDTARDQPAAIIWINKAAAQGQPLAIKALNMINQQQTPTMGEVGVQGGSPSSHSRVAPPGHRQSRQLGRRSGRIKYSSSAVHVAPARSFAAQPPVGRVVPSVPVTASRGTSRVNFSPADVNSRSVLSSRKVIAKKSYMGTDKLALLKMPSQNYSLQLMARQKPGPLQAFKRRHHLNTAWIYEKQIKGKTWYVLVQGDYSSRMQAEMAKQKLSPSLRKLSPWVKRFGKVQLEIKELG